MSRRGRIASDRLTTALVAMASQGLRPNCSDPESHWMWLSEHPQETQTTNKTGSLAAQSSPNATRPPKPTGNASERCQAAATHHHTSALLAASTGGARDNFVSVSPV